MNAEYRSAWRIKNLDSVKASARKWTINNRDKFNAIRRKWVKNNRIRKRAAVIERFGGTCVRCRFSDARALQIDHINGGGGRELNTMRNTTYYDHLLKINDVDLFAKYQLLCANCNWIKRIEQNEVPAKE